MIGGKREQATVRFDDVLSSKLVEPASTKGGRLWRVDARDEHEAPPRTSAVRRELAGLVVPLVAFVLLAVLAIAVELARDASGGSHGGEGDETGGADTDAIAEGSSVARVRGKILLEAFDERELLDPALLDPSRDPAVDPATVPEPAPTIDTDGSEPPADGPPTTAPELSPPPAGSCRIVAWQAGVQVGGPATCDEHGDFEIELSPGIAGVTAFELEVPGRLRAVVEADVPIGSVGRLPPVALGLGQPLTGLVTDARNVAIAGVVVEARPVPDLAEPEPWRATSDAEGKFAFDTLPPGPVTIRCAPPGYAASVVDAIAPQADVLVVLDAMMVLAGSVVGPPDVLARTIVRAEGSGVWPAREAKLDGDGAFALPAIPDGIYGIEAVAAAVNPGEPEFASIPLENVTPDQHVTLALAQAYRVPVRVVNVEGDPIADARVTLGNAHIGLLQRVARTDAAGRTEIGPVVSGAYVVRADADGMLAGNPAALALENATPQEVVLTLVRPARIAGVVVDEDDRPVEGAVIEIGGEVAYSAGEGSMRARVFDRTLASGGSLGVTTGPVPDIPDFMPNRAGPDTAGMLVSDSDGRFVLADLSAGPYRLQATHGRYAMSDAVLVNVKAGGGSYEVRLRLREGEPVTGRVLDDNLRPIAGASIELDDGSAVVTDARGVFDAGLRRGAVVLVARADGMVPARRELDVRNRAVDIEIVLVRAEAVVRGHVVDDNLRPLANVRVTLRTFDDVMPTELAWTDDRGVFAFETLPVGAVELEIDAAGHAARTMKARAVEAGREVPIEIVMVAGWHLRVDVRNRDTGDPIADAEVVADGRFVRTDARGVAEIDSLADDTILLDVTADGYGSRSVTARRGDTATTVEVVVELAEGGSVEGLVSDWRGDPVVGATVVIKAGDTVVAERTSGAAGRFTADGLPEGDIVLEAWPPADREQDLAPVAQRSDVLRGRTTRGIDLRLERK